MSKYLLLYSSTTPAEELMAKSTPEQMKAGMETFIKWREEASKIAKVEFGLPLKAIVHLTQDTSGPSDSIVSGYAIIEGDSKDAILELLKSHPHLGRPGATIDVLEMLPMPGLDVKA